MTTRALRACAATFLALAAPWLASCGSARRSEPVTAPLALDSPQTAAGRAVFQRTCDRCHPHGEAGLGPALNNKWLPGFAIRYQVRHGIGSMPSFPERVISDEELDGLIAYLMALRSNKE